MQKQTKNNLSFNSCKFLCVIFLVLFYIFIVISLQSDAIFVLSGTKNDIAGQKTISRDISFLCHRVIARIKAQVCDKYIYNNTFRFSFARNVWIFSLYIGHFYICTSRSWTFSLSKVKFLLKCLDKRRFLKNENLLFFFY